MDDGSVYEGFVSGEPYDAARPPDFSRSFDEALQQAVDKVPPSQHGPFEVICQITIQHSSPGWIDGYRVVLKPPR